jgi:hypothetical protein
LTVVEVAVVALQRVGIRLTVWVLVVMAVQELPHQ